MSNYFGGQFTAKVIMVACCLALIDKQSNAFLLANFIGCNSFGCRISALEQDVGQLKQQVMRLSGGGMNGMNGYQQPNTMPYNQNQMMNQNGGGMNQQLQPNQFNQNGQQGTQPQQQQQQQQPQQQGNTPTTRQSYMPGQYPDELRRVQGVVPYQNSLNGQFLSA